MPIAVFFLETPRAPLVTAASAGIEAAVGIRRRVKPGSGKVPPLGPVNETGDVDSDWLVNDVQPPSGPMYQAPATPGWFHGNSCACA